MYKLRRLQSKILSISFAIAAAVALAILMSTPEPSARAEIGGAATVYRLPITVNNTEVHADLTDFPVYVNLANMPANFWTHVSPGCGDIRVTTNDGFTEVPREVVTCIDNGTTGTGELHFKAPLLSDTANTTFYIYYGTGASDYAPSAAYGAQNVWTNGYVGVWHLGENGNIAAGGYKDSTANALNGTGVSMTSSSDVAGQVGVGQVLDGAADYIKIPHNALLNHGTGEFTWSIWIKSTTGSTGANSKVLSKRPTASPQWTLQLSNRNNPAMEWGASGNAIIGTSDASNNVWHFLAMAKNGTTGKIVVDGVSQNTGTPSSNEDNTGELRFGNCQLCGAGENLNGTIDEVRVSSVGRSNSWLLTEYINQNSPSPTFYSVGAEQNISAPAVSPNTTSSSNGGQLIDYAWSDNIGWIYFSPGVYVSSSDAVGDQGTLLGGWAWNDTVGWISFNQTDYSELNSSGACSSNCSPRLSGTKGNPGTLKLAGWARACSGTIYGNCGGSGNISRTDGWDGWIKLDGWASNPIATYGGGNWTLKGFGWGSDVVGWISYDPSNASCNSTTCKTTLLLTQCNDGIDNEGIQGIDLADPDCADRSTASEGVAIPPPSMSGAFTATSPVRKGSSSTLGWAAIQNVSSCNIDSNPDVSGAGWTSGNYTVPVASNTANAGSQVAPNLQTNPTVFTLTCVASDGISTFTPRTATVVVTPIPKYQEI